MVNAPDCGSGDRGFESLYPPLFSAAAHIGVYRSSLMMGYSLGYRQGVRHSTLTAAFPGPNPGSPVSQMFSSFGLCHLRIFHLHGILLSPHSGMLLRAVARLVRVFRFPSHGVGRVERPLKKQSMGTPVRHCKKNWYGQ